MFAIDFDGLNLCSQLFYVSFVAKEKRLGGGGNRNTTDLDSRDG